MRKHSVVITGHQTSLSLEDEFWEELRRIAIQQKISLTQLIENIDNKRRTNLSSALRVYILETLKEEIINNKNT